MYPSKELPQYAVFIEQQAKALISLGNIVDVLIPLYKPEMQKSIFNDITLWYIPFRFMERSLFYSYSAWRFINNINQSDLDIGSYDILHIHACDTPILIAFEKLAKKYDKKLVIHYHGYNIFKDYGVKEDKAFLHNSLPIKKKLICKANGVMCISKKVEAVILSECPKAKTYVVYNGVDTDLFYPTDKKGNSIKKIICVANLINIKGHKFLIEAFYHLIKIFDNIQLDIMGRGEEEESLKELVEKYNLKGKVNFYGYISYDSVAEKMRSSDILVLPSFYEGLGCVCLEAMASKVATVACYGAGIDEILEDGINGMLVAPQSAESIKQCLVKLLSDDFYREDIAQAGYESVRKLYKWIDCAENIVKAYKEVLNG